MILVIIKIVVTPHLKNVKNKDKEDIWIPSSRTIQIVIPVAIKNILIMVHRFIKILTETHRKKTNSSYKTFREKEAIPFMTLDKLLTQKKNRTFFSINPTQIISCKILSLILSLPWKKPNQRQVFPIFRKKSYKIS